MADAENIDAKEAALNASLSDFARIYADEMGYAVDAGHSGEPGTPRERFALLRKETSEYLTDEEEGLLQSAFDFAESSHKGQLRKSGEPYIAHPVEVALILASLRMDAETMAAALLHDVVEDTDASHEDLVAMFGENVARLVDGVTKISRIEVESLTAEQAETIRKMFVAMSKDIRVIVIKLADRLHNMRTLYALSEDRRIFKSRETLEIYAPIAHRLGISSVKWELEDLSFYYLEPVKFRQVSRMVAATRVEREEYIQRVSAILRDEMESLRIECQIMGRPKHLYSIYQKMTRQGKGFSEIYDLIALRIITKSVKDCYSALGAVHTLWHPMPGRFKDYIAMPKYNMYQSLHTTVIGPAGRPLEVQIRTEEMHRMSEYGVAAHWRYKESGGSNKLANDDFSRQLAWLREMIDWQSDTQDSREFLKSLKVDLTPNEVFVFTPKGEVRQLRAGATPIDFAYAIHTEVGHHCVGAKVNGRIVPLNYRLQLGDRVDIMTQKSAQPSRDWLNIVKTPKARTKIRQYLAKVSRSDDLQTGYDRLRYEMRKHDLGLSNAQSQRILKEVALTMGYRDEEEMTIKVGAGKENAQRVVNRLLKILVDRANADAAQPHIGMSASSTGKMPPMLTSVKRPKHHETHTDSGIVVRGISNVLVKLAKCCNPVPGDGIIGFVTRGRGVSVHRSDCPNATQLLKDPGRIIEVCWEDRENNESTYKVEIVVEALDRMSLLADVAQVLSANGANVLRSTSHAHSGGMAEMRFILQISDVDVIARITDGLNAVDGVFEARREIPGAGKRG